MRDVSIIGIGQTKVAEHWDRSLRHLAGDAVLASMRDANIETADALYVGNMLSGLLTGQEHLGALVADFVGLRGIEAIKVEAACGSGAAALRQGYAAVAGGLHDVVIACLGESAIEARRGGAGDESGAAKGPFFCFARRHPFDVLIGQDKVAGSAQRRTRNAVLQHGSIILERRYEQQPAGTSGSPADELAGRFGSILALRTRCQVERGCWSAVERSASDELVAKYSGAEWTRRR